MNTAHWALIGALAVQVLLAVFTWWPRGSVSHEAHDLIELDRDAVTEITVLGSPRDGKDADPVVLRKEGGGWVVASANGYPADRSTVDGLLRKLDELEVRAPVASTMASFNSLDVGDRKYQRKVVVEAGENEHTVYLGGATASRVYVRTTAEDEAYLSSAFSVWSIPDTADRYLDKTYVDLEPDSVTALTITNPEGTVDLFRDGDAWTTAELPQGKAIDVNDVEQLLDTLSGLQLVEAVGTEITREQRLDPAETTVTWTRNGTDATEQGRLRIGAEVDSRVFLKSDSSAFVVKASKTAVDKLRQAKLHDLLVDAAPAGDDEAPTDALQPPGP